MNFAWGGAEIGATPLLELSDPEMCDRWLVSLPTTEMKAFINQMRAALHHGRGSKYTRKKNFKLALEHFQAAAKYAVNSNGQACVALEIECIARTFARLGDSVKAKQNAEESLRLYKLEAPGPAIDESIKRVSELVKILEARGGQAEP